MKRKGTVAAIIVLFICVAVYLNLNTTEVSVDDERIKTTLGVQTETTEEKAEEKDESYRSNC